MRIHIITQIEYKKTKEININEYHSVLKAISQNMNTFWTMQKKKNNVAFISVLYKQINTYYPDNWLLKIAFWTI